MAGKPSWYDGYKQRQAQAQKAQKAQTAQHHKPWVLPATPVGNAEQHTSTKRNLCSKILIIMIGLMVLHFFILAFCRAVEWQDKQGEEAQLARTNIRKCGELVKCSRDKDKSAEEREFCARQWDDDHNGSNVCGINWHNKLRQIKNQQKKSATYLHVHDEYSSWGTGILQAIVEGFEACWPDMKLTFALLLPYTERILTFLGATIGVIIAYTQGRQSVVGTPVRTQKQT